MIVGNRLFLVFATEPYSYPNTNKTTGRTFFNKDRKAIPDSMNQQDIRTVRNILKRRNNQ
ncbi:hypothetical protein BMR02_13965 [Methylococcaceae bacterium HT1]|nr:hypothetical protein BMR02_13965 [Methylococcaceae bacterium HT1]